MATELIYSKSTLVDSTHVDRWGRMRPSALLEIMQETACDHAQTLGVGRERLAEQNLFWAIVRQTLEICRLPGIGETLVTETWPGPPSRTAFPRYMTGRTPQGELLFRAVTLWLFMDYGTRAMVLPGASGIQVPSLLRGGELANPTGIAPREYPNLERRRVRYSELDCNGHLSNTKYLNWMEDLLPGEYHRNHSLSRLHICYLNEALEGQEISLNWALEDDRLSLEGRRDQEDGANRVFALRAEYRNL
ncbi:MAG: thioesterase [Candidatus Faecousia sp.]|nr:thioesterase [Clostridiales bacterium]MDD7651430.1 thioesterase [Bacillota bacterium]MDY4220027.1 thioesterase [Candidatus Faecousia sp.]